MKLTVVTLVTRPQNLPAIARSIAAAAAALEGAELSWLVLFDQAKVGASVELPADAIEATEGYYVEVAPDWCGEPFLRNKALDLIPAGHIAWLDDDNLMHAGFLVDLAARLAARPDAVVVYDQTLGDGTPRLTAAPDNMRFGAVDTAQVIAPRDVYRSYRFDNLQNGTDGYMFERLWQSSGPRFVFVERPLVLYNALAR